MTNAQVNYINEEVTVKKMNIFQRIIGIILSPGKVMDSLAEKPRVIFPLIMIAVAQLAFYLVRLPLYQDFLRQATGASSAMVESLTGTKMTPEMIELGVNRGTQQIYYMTPISALFMWLVISVVFFAIFKIAGGQGKFKAYLSVTGYAYIISVLYLILALAVSFFTNSLHLLMPLTSLGNLLPESMKGNFLYGVVKGIDIFAIWYYAVIAIGLTSVSGFKKRTVYAIVAVVFVVGLLIAGGSELALGKYM
jgi:hypothetical protein